MNARWDPVDPVTLSDGAVFATQRRPGRPGTPDVVLVPGGSGAWDALEPLAEVIGDEATIHRYRRLEREPSSGVRSVERRVADLDELRQHWGLARMVLIGHWLGAAPALAYAAAHPERVGAVAHLCGIGLGEPDSPFADADLIGWAAATRCPVHFIHATADARPAVHAMQLADRTPIARKRVVSDAGHLPWVEQPEQVRELLLEIVRAGR